MNNCFSIYHTSWITSAQRATLFVKIYRPKATLFFLGCSEVNSTWLITSELANQRARKVLFTCVVYTNTIIFSAQNRQKNKNIQPGSEKQHSYKKKKRVYIYGESRSIATQKTVCSFTIFSHGNDYRKIPSNRIQLCLTDTETDALFDPSLTSAACFGS